MEVRQVEGERSQERQEDNMRRKGSPTRQRDAAARMLAHQFRLHSVPKGLEGLSPEFLADLYDLLHAYGARDRDQRRGVFLPPLFGDTAPAIAYKGAPQQFLVVGGGGRRGDPLTFEAGSHCALWDSGVSVEDLQDVMQLYDTCMTAIKFYDGACGFRLPILGLNPESLQGTELDADAVFARSGSMQLMPEEHAEPFRRRFADPDLLFSMRVGERTNVLAFGHRRDRRHFEECPTRLPYTQGKIAAAVVTSIDETEGMGFYLPGPSERTVDWILSNYLAARAQTEAAMDELIRSLETN